MIEKTTAQFNKNILIAVDCSDNSRRAVAYVAKMLGGVADVNITLLHVIPEPEEDFFADDAERETWLINYTGTCELQMADYRGLLVDAGFAPETVRQRITQRFCPSMAECILAERDDRSYHTIVVGRQGLSRKEEFLFGSISSRIVNHARDCTVWVVA